MSQDQSPEQTENGIKPSFTNRVLRFIPGLRSKPAPNIPKTQERQEILDEAAKLRARKYLESIQAELRPLQEPKKLEAIPVTAYLERLSRETPIDARNLDEVVQAFQKKAKDPTRKGPATLVAVGSSINFNKKLPGNDIDLLLILPDDMPDIHGTEYEQSVRAFKAGDEFLGNVLPGITTSSIDSQPPIPDHEHERGMLRRQGKFVLSFEQGVPVDIIPVLANGIQDTITANRPWAVLAQT